MLSCLGIRDVNDYSTFRLHMYHSVTTIIVDFQILLTFEYSYLGVHVLEEANLKLLSILNTIQGNNF